MAQSTHAKDSPEIVLTRNDSDLGWGHLNGARVTPVPSVLTSGTPATSIARLEGTGLCVKRKCPHEGGHGYYFRGRNRTHSWWLRDCEG